MLKKKECKYAYYYDDGLKEQYFIYGGGVPINNLDIGDIVSLEEYKCIYLGIDNAGYLYLLRYATIYRFSPKSNNSPIIENGNFIESGSKNLFA